MTEIETNILIAEWLGWKYQDSCGDAGGCRIVRPDGEHSGEWYGTHEAAGLAEFPFYTTDLNACREFEEKVMATKFNCHVWADAKTRYRDRLRSIVVGDYGKPLLSGDLELLFATATAAQRCAAMVRVIREEQDKQTVHPDAEKA